MFGVNQKSFDFFLENSKAAQVAAELLGDPEGVWIFKERLNYKLPGGGGFSPHQDAPAWSGTSPVEEGNELPFMHASLNMNVAIDPMFEENGGLLVVPGIFSWYS